MSSNYRKFPIHRVCIPAFLPRRFLGTHRGLNHLLNYGFRHCNDPNKPIVPTEGNAEWMGIYILCLRLQTGVYTEVASLNL